MRRLRLLCVAALIAATMSAPRVGAIATDASELSCAPANVLPGQNMTCTIRGRDATQETTRAEPTDFIPQVHADTPGADVAVSVIRRTEDETLVAFTVSSAVGTRLSVDVVARNGLPVRGSGFQGLVYAAPPTALGAITCDVATLTLRTTATCRVPATGAHDVPAVVAPTDVYFSEDHGDGSFQYVAGAGAFVFTFSAPNSPSARYNAFVLRVALSNAPLAAPRNISLPIAFPREAPTPRSTLVCSDADSSRCVVNAANTGGPVHFAPDDFVLSFDRDTSNNDAAPAWQATETMDAVWSPANGAQLESVANLRIDQRVRRDVYRVRTHVRLASTGEEVSGSPHVFTSGVPPAGADVTFRRCAQSFMVAGRATTCYLSVDSSASAAPRFMSAAVVDGAGEVGEFFYIHGNATGVASLEGMALVAFNFTAPEELDERLDIIVAVTAAGGEAVLRSPIRLVAFPAKLGNEVEAEKNKRPPVIALGLCFFGSAYMLGFAAFMKRRNRLHRVKANRRVREMKRIDEEELQARQARQARRENGARQQMPDGGVSGSGSVDPDSAAVALAALHPQAPSDVAVRPLRQSERTDLVAPGNVAPDGTSPTGTSSEQMPNAE